MTAGHGGDDAAMRAVALAGLRSAKSMREIAVDLYGAREVALEWHRDGWMRPMVQCLVKRGGRNGRGAGQRRPPNPMTAGNDTERAAGVGFGSASRRRQPRARLLLPPRQVFLG